MVLLAASTSALGLLDQFWLYAAYMFFLLVATFALRYPNRSTNQAIDAFFGYVRKGRKRVARLGDFFLFFFLAQILYIFAYLLLSFWVYFVISLVVAYLLALNADRIKKHRHNGIPIGYEYPHPIGVESDTSTTPHGTQMKTTKITHAGSKGVYDLQVKSEPNPHAMVIGESGSGKTTLVTTFLARSYSKLGIPFLILDWSGSYRNELDVNVWKVPDNLRINPFALRGMSQERRSGIAAELLQFALALTDLQMQKVRETLLSMYQDNEEPTIATLREELEDAIRLESHRELKLQLRYIIEKLKQASEVFGAEDTAFWDNYDKSCDTVDLEGLTDSEKKLVTYTVMQRIIEEFKMHEGVKLYIGIDDAYQALLDYYGKETNITRIVREGRKYGFGLLISTQMLKDLPDAIVANTSMKFLMGYHEPYALERIHKMFHMTDVEKEILHRMPTGSCLLFDENAIHGGKVNPAYIEVDRVAKEERNTLASSIKRLEIGRVPLTAQRRLHKADTVEGIQMPQVSVYRFLVAMDKQKELGKALKWLREKGLITSNRTLYGGSGVVPIQQRAVDDGYITGTGTLTKKALEIINPYYLVARQGERKGGEDHKAMMRRIIEAEQEAGGFVFVPSISEGFDVGVVGTGRRKGTWDESRLRGYEVQTNSIRSEIDRCVEKAKAGKYQLVFATNSNSVKKEIEDMVGSAYKVIMVKPYPSQEET